MPEKVRNEETNKEKLLIQKRIKKPSYHWKGLGG